MGDYGDAMLRNPNAAVQARTKAQNRVNVMQLKLIGQSHPTGLTANLLKLFEPRPPLEYKPPPEKRKCLPYTGMAQFVKTFAEPGDPDYAPPVVKGETPAERRARIHQIRLEEGAKKVAEELEKYDPNSDPNISGDPYKTLFVARLNYETTESRIKREFEAYGPIKRVTLVTDKESNKPRGYAFIEYLHMRDMKAAYKQADGKKIDNRRVLVDVERGRTVPNWRPRRLGGGLGTTRMGNEESSNSRHLVSAHSGGGVSRSEEPKADREQEKPSRERGEREREREREKSRELSHDRPRERESRDDRHHRDRERTKEKDRERRDRDRDRDRDHGRDKDRGRDRERPRDHDREQPRDRHHRERERERGKKRDRDEYNADDRERGRSHDRERGRSREYEYERGGESRHHERNYDVAEGDDGWDGGGGPSEPGRGGGHYDYYAGNPNPGGGGGSQRGFYDNPPGGDDDEEEDDGGRYQRSNDGYEDDGGYGYDRAAAQRSNRSQSQDYEY